MTRHWKWHQSDEIVVKLEQAARLTARGASPAEAAQAIGVSAATYFRWRKQYAGLKPQHVNLIRKLQQELLRLRAVVREHDLGESVVDGVEPPSPHPSGAKVRKKPTMDSRRASAGAGDARTRGLSQARAAK